MNKLFQSYLLNPAITGYVVHTAPSTEYLRRSEIAKNLSDDSLRARINSSSKEQSIPWQNELNRRQGLPTDVNYHMGMLRRRDDMESHLLDVNKKIGLAYLANAVLGKVTDMNTKKTEGSKIRKLYEYMNNKGITPDIEVNTTFTGGQYSPSTNAILTAPDLATAAHEYGHAQNEVFRRKFMSPTASRIYHNFTTANVGHFIPATNHISFLRPVANIPLSGLVLAPLMTRPVLDMLRNKHTNKVIDKLEDHPEYVMGVAVAPKLLEEASASARAIKSIRAITPEAQKATETWKAIKTLTPAFGTYVAGALMPILLTKLINIHERKK